MSPTDFYIRFSREQWREQWREFRLFVRFRFIPLFLFRFSTFYGFVLILYQVPLSLQCNGNRVLIRTVGKNLDYLYVYTLKISSA